MVDLAIWLQQARPTSFGKLSSSNRSLERVKTSIPVKSDLCKLVIHIRPALVETADGLRKVS